MPAATARAASGDRLMMAATSAMRISFADSLARASARARSLAESSMRSRTGATMSWSLSSLLPLGETRAVSGYI